MPKNAVCVILWVIALVTDAIGVVCHNGGRLPVEATLGYTIFFTVVV